MCIKTLFRKHLIDTLSIYVKEMLLKIIYLRWQFNMGPVSQIKVRHPVYKSSPCHEWHTNNCNKDMRIQVDTEWIAYHVVVI